MKMPSLFKQPEQAPIIDWDALQQLDSTEWFGGLRSDGKQIDTLQLISRIKEPEERTMALYRFTILNTDKLGAEGALLYSAAINREKLMGNLSDHPLTTVNDQQWVGGIRSESSQHEFLSRICGESDPQKQRTALAAFNTTNGDRLNTPEARRYVVATNKTKVWLAEAENLTSVQLRETYLEQRFKEDAAFVSAHNLDEYKKIRPEVHQQTLNKSTQELREAYVYIQFKNDPAFDGTPAKLYYDQTENPKAVEVAEQNIASKKLQGTEHLTALTKEVDRVKQAAARDVVQNLYIESAMNLEKMRNSVSATVTLDDYKKANPDFVEFVESKRITFSVPNQTDSKTLRPEDLRILNEVDQVRAISAFSTEQLQDRLLDRDLKTDVTYGAISPGVDLDGYKKANPSKVEETAKLTRPALIRKELAASPDLDQQYKATMSEAKPRYNDQLFAELNKQNVTTASRKI